MDTGPSTKENSWPINWSAFASFPRDAKPLVSTLLIITTLLLLSIGTLSLGWLFVDLISGDQRRAAEAAKASLPILAAAIGLPLLIWRLRILDRQTRISEDKTQIDRETHYTSIFSRSIDQLGQTREFKYSINTGGAADVVIRTAPNIEVRLGGIHSLTRLAEESQRDRAKIGSTLLSYVRENSWLDRDGSRSSKPLIPEGRIGIWAYKYRQGIQNDDDRKQYEKWRDTFVSNGKIESNWGLPLTETRVDVNEAIDAISKSDFDAATTAPLRFFECLFVARQFDDALLSRVQFERCTFVRCSFFPKQSNQLTFHKSTFISSLLKAKDNKLSFSECRSETLKLDIQRCDVDLISCHMNSLRIDTNEEHNTIKFNGGYFHKMWIDNGTYSIRGRMTVFSDSNFEGLRFDSSSSLKNCGFPDSLFGATDLSEATIEPAASLSAAKGDEKTRLPKDSVRPPLWPDLNPEQE